MPASDGSFVRGGSDAAFTNYQIYNAAEDPVLNPDGLAAPVGRTPAQIRKSYGVDNIFFNGIVGDGTGQTIAIVDAYDSPSFVSSTDANFINSDLHKFDVQFGLPDPPSFTKVSQTGTTVYPAYNSGWAGEIALDVEWAHAMAPGASIVLVEATTNSGSNLRAATNYAKSLSNVSVISHSFGSVEASNGSSESAYVANANHQGVTFFASSGDTGGQVNYPATSPNIVAVGGTHLNQVNSTGTYSSETGWTGSGGGASAQFAKPAYQNLITTNVASRGEPDVSAVADPSTGVAVLDSSAGGIGSADGWFNGYIGGTSLSSPLWAGMVAIANQGRALASTPLAALNGVSQTLPRLYSLSTADFHDITSGTAGANTAVVGYDLVTGRGSPIANKLIPDLAGAATITGKIYSDANGNGLNDSGEAGISGVNVYVDINNNQAADTLEPTATTNASGVYTFADQIGGQTFTVRETLPSGYTTVDGTVAATSAYNTVTSGRDISNDPILPLALKSSAINPGVTRNVVATFNAAVDPASLSVSDLTALNTTTAESFTPIGVVLSNGNKIATFTLPASISDGNYAFKIAAGSVTNAANTALASDLAIGSTFFLGGDANRDRSVDTLDFATLIANFGTASPTFAKGDFTYDNVINSADFNRLAASYGKVIAAPAELPATASASATSPFSSGGAAVSDLDELLA